MFSDYFLLAFKNVRKRGIRSWLTMLGIFIGIAAVVSLISLGQGLQTAITGQFGALSVDTLVIQGASTGFAPPGSASVSKISQKEFELIQNTAGVRIAIPRYLRAGQIEYNDEVSYGYVASLPSDEKQIEEVYTSLNVGVEEGDLLRSTDRGKVIVGHDFVKTDQYGRPIRIGSVLTIQSKDFEVIGILENTGSFTTNGAILMPEEDMKDIFDIPKDEIDFVAARISSTDKIDTVSEELKRKIRRERNEKPGEEDFEVQTPAESLSAVNTILSVINIVVTGIALIALLVGGIGIANTMFTSVLERTKEIGVMKAIGAENSDILKIFIIESALLGFIGGVVGAGIGLAFAFLVAFIANIALGNSLFTVTPSYPLLIGALLFSLLIGIVSGIVPALQASKLNPVEALRK